jgi:hypothetical protein
MKNEDYNGGLPPDHPLNRGVFVMSLGQGRAESPPPESLEPIEAEATERDNDLDNSEAK